MPCAEDWAACRSLPTPYQCILNSLGSTDSSTHSKTACQAHRTYPLGRRRITVHECFCYLGQSDAVAKHLPLLGPSTGSSTEANQHKSYIRFREFRSFFPCVCVCVFYCLFARICLMRIARASLRCIRKFGNRAMTPPTTLVAPSTHPLCPHRIRPGDSFDALSPVTSRDLGRALQIRARAGVTNICKLYKTKSFSTV